VFDLVIQVTETKASIRGWLLTGNEISKAEVDRSWNNIKRIEENVENELKSNPK